MKLPPIVSAIVLCLFIGVGIGAGLMLLSGHQHPSAQGEASQKGPPGGGKPKGAKPKAEAPTPDVAEKPDEATKPR